jgi:hypothetical protein
MNVRLRTRIALVLCGWMTVTVVIWQYVATHDLARTWRQFWAGRGLLWPPPAKHGPRQDPLHQATHAFAAVLDAARPAALALLLVGAGLVAGRLWHRRQRAASTRTWELRLGRDDHATPYRVQEALEAILGAITARWYERLWRGQDHIAFEIHRLRDKSIAFTVAARAQLRAAIRGGLEDLYPDVELVETAGRPNLAGCVVRLKKRRVFVLSLLTTRDYDHAFSESLVAQLGAIDGELSVQLVLTPAPGWAYRRARKLLKRRERRLNQQDRRDPADPGMDSVVEAKELKGGLESQHHSLAAFDLRVAGTDAQTVRQVAGLFSTARSENELVRREMRVRRALYARRLQSALPNPLMSWRTGLLSTSELATLWQLPGGRTKHAPVRRASVRRAIAPPEIDRTPERALMWDERGPVTIAPADRKKGHALLGGQGTGKSSAMARHFANDAQDPNRVPILLDPKGDLAEICRSLVPQSRVLHYVDLGHPEIGFNPLTVPGSPSARADMLLRALIDANSPGAIQAASDSFLRQATSAVCTVEPKPTLWHVYRMLDLGESDYRESVIARLEQTPGADFARLYWRRSFRDLLDNRRFAAQALNPPRNKLERLLSTPDIDTFLRHPAALDIEGIIARGEVLIVAGAKATVGEDNAILVCQLLLHLVHRAIQAQQQLPPQRRRIVSLLIDEAHNVLVPFVAKMLSEGRSGGLEAAFAWQYLDQILDDIVRAGTRSLLQSLSIFCMREIEDARALAALAMHVFADRISVQPDEQERFRFSPEDILRLPEYEAWNLWVAGGAPRSAFKAHTKPMEELYNPRLAEHHIQAQHQRGGHHPGALPNPLPAEYDDDATSDQPTDAQPKPTTRRGRSGNKRRRGSSSTAPGHNAAGQLPLGSDIGDAPDDLGRS